MSDKAKQLTELRLIKINLMSKFCHNSFLLNMCQFDTEGDLLSWCGTFGNSKLSIVMTRCKIEFTYASHCVSKNLTPRRMLKKCFLIAKIIRWNKSFQNMYDMLQTKVDRLAEKTNFVTKKTPKIMDNFLERLTLEGAGCQTDDTRLTFRPPLKTLGHNCSN